MCTEQPVARRNAMVQSDKAAVRRRFPHKHAPAPTAAQKDAGALTSFQTVSLTVEADLRATVGAWAPASLAAAADDDDDPIDED